MNTKKNLVRIYVDHWEDYESIGDKAMLMNALRRLELHLGPSYFIGPYSPGKAGAFQYPGMITVLPPYQEVIRIAGRFRSVFLKLIKLLPSRLFAPKLASTIFLDLARYVVDFKLFLYSIGLHFVFGKPFEAFLEEIKQCDIFFVVGDCSLSDYWLDGVVLKSWLVQMVRKYVSVCVMSSQGIGPLTTPWARKRLVGALKELDILSFRDYSYSKALVEAEGLSNVSYKIVGDEAFTLPIASKDTILAVLNVAGISMETPFIVVNFRNTDFTQNTTFLLNKVAELLDRVANITKKAIVFVPMSKGNKYGRDHEAGISLKNMMKQSDRLFVLEPQDDLGLTKGIIGEAAYSLGISYHLHVFSLSMGHPTIAIYTGEYYRIKSDGLISFYGSPNRSVDFLENSIEQTMEYVNDIENQYNEACAHIGDVNKSILEQNDWTIKMVKKKLIQKGRLFNFTE